MLPVDHLLALALDAVEDANDAARIVLADALEETGWWDLRMEGLWGDDDEDVVMTFCFGDEVTPDVARAIAAILLFGDWVEGDDTASPPTLPWPVADASRRWTEEEKRVHALMAELRVDDLLARCERALAKLRHPAEVTVTTFLVPQHVAVEELRVESCFPLDEETRALCARLAQR